MAEISTGDSKDGKKRSKKTSTKVDMTPMVDLAFLLITFFMLTTNLTKKHAMAINLPDKNDIKKEQTVDKEKTVTLILGENDRIYWYVDPKKPELNVTNFSESGIRDLLDTRKKSVDTLITIIKPMKDSKYKNLVDMMDEINIADIRKSAIVDITADEEKLVAEYKKTFNIQ
ncbi:MAG: biopolymer transporter ExbD [Cytophagaceae bacterium]|nr:biopolymer transporter ExbD [Cytophagaceae bacterium]